MRQKNRYILWKVTTTSYRIRGSINDRSIRITGNSLAGWSVVSQKKSVFSPSAEAFLEYSSKLSPFKFLYGGCPERL